MRTIIAGSRSIIRMSALTDAIRKSEGFITITEVVSGGANGPDKLGEAWALLNNIPIKRFPADWESHGKQAGLIRNKQMAEYGEALIALWDGESKGTAHMIRIAGEKNIPTFIRVIRGF